MTLLRRRPREVYRVYSEEEYLGGAGTQLGGIAEWHAAEPELVELGSVEEWPVEVAQLGSAGEPPVGEPESAAGEEWPLEEPSLPFEEPVGQHAEWVPGRGDEHRLRRAAGLATLAGVLGAVGCLVCLNFARTHGAHTPGRGSLLAATRSTRVAGSASAADDVRSQVESSRPVVAPPVETARSRFSSRSGESRKGGPDHRSSARLPAHRPAHRPAGVVVLVDHAHRRRSSGEASAAPVPTPASVPAPAPTSADASAPQAGGTTTAAVVAAPAHPAPEGQAEFGFER